VNLVYRKHQKTKAPVCIRDSEFISDESSEDLSCVGQSEIGDNLEKEELADELQKVSLEKNEESGKEAKGSKVDEVDGKGGSCTVDLTAELTAGDLMDDLTGDLTGDITGDLTGDLKTESLMKSAHQSQYGTSEEGPFENEKQQMLSLRKELLADLRDMIEFLIDIEENCRNYVPNNEETLREQNEQKSYDGIKKKLNSLTIAKITVGGTMAKIRVELGGSFTSQFALFTNLYCSTAIYLENRIELEHYKQKLIKEKYAKKVREAKEKIDREVLQNQQLLKSMESRRKKRSLKSYLG